MKGIILAGGTGTRLDPLTRITNKHLLPVYDRPMIYFAVEALVQCGIDEIMIVTGGNQAGEFLRLLGNGSEFGLRHLDYAYQDRPGGIGEALGLAEHFAGGGPVAVLLGDNIFERSIAPYADMFRASPHGALLVLAKVPDPTAYGAAVFDGDRLVKVIEKPPVAPSPFIATGLYFYDARVFGFTRELRPSGRGELEIVDVMNRYIDAGEARHVETEGYWMDCGESVAALLRASNLVATKGANRRHVVA